ncbi:hypothetical protein ACR6C2_44200 [Streptomyces sp. INA 01156]
MTNVANTLTTISAAQVMTRAVIYQGVFSSAPALCPSRAEAEPGLASSPLHGEGSSRLSDRAGDHGRRRAGARRGHPSAPGGAGREDMPAERVGRTVRGVERVRP